MAESTSKLRSQVKALTNVNGGGGVDILADEKTFRSTYDIMSDIADVWQDMSDIDQSALLELLAGKVRSNQVAALLSNFDQAEKAMKTSQNAEGTMDKVHRAWMDSVEARKAQFEAAQETLSMTVMPANTLKGLYQTGTSALGLLNTVIGGTGSLGFGAGIFGVANALRSGGGNIAAGLGNMLGIHRDTINGGFTRGNLDFINRYNEAFSETGNKQEAFALATQGANKALDSYTMSLYGSTSGLIDARKVTTGFGSAIKSFAKNALVGVGTFAAMEGAAFLMNKAWQFVDSQILNRGETLANNAATAHANYEAVQNEANTTAEKVQTTQEQINELRSKPALTPSESQQLVDLESQMRSLAFMQRLLDAQAQQAAAEGLSAWNESYADQVKNQLGAESLFNDEMFVSPEQLFGDNADSIEEVAKWFDQAVSKAYEAMQAAEYGSHEYNAAEDAMRQLNEASESLRHDYDNAGEFFETGRGRDAVKLAAAYTDAKQLSTEQRSQGRVEALQEKYNEQYADKTLAAVRAQAEALAEHVGQMGDMSRFSPEAVAAGYATAKGLYDQLAQSAEQAGDAVGQLSDIDAVKNFEGIWTSFKSAVSGRMMDLQDSVQTAFTDYAGAGYKGDTTYLKQALTGYMALRRALEPNGDYDALRAVLKGSSLENVVGSLDALAAESEITAEDIKDLKVDGVINAGDKLQNFLELAGLSVEDFAGMVNAAAKQAADRSGQSGAGAPAKVDIFGERQASVSKALAAQDTGSKIWAASGYTGGMTEADYQSLVDLGDEAYLAAVEYAQGGLFFNKDAFDRVVQDKYKEELAGLQKDVVSAQEKYRDAANRMIEQASKARSGDTSFSDTVLQQAYQDLGAAATELDGYRRMQAQLQYNMGDYANWLNNKSGPESGDMYNEVGQAAQAILSGKASGKIGTRQFEAAMRFFTGKENFDISKLTARDWSLIRGAAGVDSQGNAQKGLSSNTLWGVAKDLQKLGILGENLGFTKPISMDEVAQRYNEAYGADTSSSFMESVFKGLNEFIQNPNDKFDMSAPETPEQRAASEAYDKFMQAAKDYNDKKISADELLNAANELEQATNNAMLTSENSELAAEAAKDLAAQAAAEEQRKGQADIASQQLEALNKIADYTQKQYELQTGSGGEGTGSEEEIDAAASQAEAEAQKKAAIAAGLEADAAQDRIDELRKAEREEAAEQAQVDAYANAQRKQEQMHNRALSAALLDQQERAQREADDRTAGQLLAQRGQLSQLNDLIDQVGGIGNIADPGLRQAVQQVADTLAGYNQNGRVIGEGDVSEQIGQAISDLTTYSYEKQEYDDAKAISAAYENKKALAEQRALTEQVQETAEQLQDAGGTVDTATTNAIAQLEDVNESGGLITPELKKTLQDGVARMKADIAAMKEEAKEPVEDTTVSVPITEETIPQLPAEEQKTAELALKAAQSQAEIAATQAETVQQEAEAVNQFAGYDQFIEDFNAGLDWESAAEANNRVEAAYDRAEKLTQQISDFIGKNGLDGNEDLWNAGEALKNAYAQGSDNIEELVNEAEQTLKTATDTARAEKLATLEAERAEQEAQDRALAEHEAAVAAAEAAAAAKDSEQAKEDQKQAQMEQDKQTLSGSNMPQEAKDLAQIAETPEDLREVAQAASEMTAAIDSGDFEKGFELAGKFAEQLKNAYDRIQQRRADEAAAAAQLAADRQAKLEGMQSEKNQAITAAASVEDQLAIAEASGKAQLAYENEQWDEFENALGELDNTLQQANKNTLERERAAQEAQDQRELNEAIAAQAAEQARAERGAATEEAEAALADALHNYGASEELTGAYDKLSQALTDETQTAEDIRGLTDALNDLNHTQNQEQAETEKQNAINAALQKDAEEEAAQAKAAMTAAESEELAQQMALTQEDISEHQQKTVAQARAEASEAAQAELDRMTQLGGEHMAEGAVEAYNALNDALHAEGSTVGEIRELTTALKDLNDATEQAAEAAQAESEANAQAQRLAQAQQAGEDTGRAELAAEAKAGGLPIALTEDQINAIYDRADEVAQNVKDFTSKNLDGNEALMAAGIELANFVAGLGSEISPQELSQLTDKTQAMLDEAMGVVKEQEHTQESTTSATEQTGAGEQAPTSAVGGAGTEQPDAVTSASVEPEIPGRQQQVSVDTKNATIEVPSGSLGVSSDLRMEGQSALFGLEDSSYAAGMRPSGEALSDAEMQAVNNAISSLARALSGDSATALTEAINTADQIMRGNIATGTQTTSEPAATGSGGGGGGAVETQTVQATVETPEVPTPDVSPVQIPVEVEDAEVPTPEAPSVTIAVSWGDPGSLNVQQPAGVTIPVSWGNPGPAPSYGGGGGGTISIGAGVAAASGEEKAASGRYLVDEHGAELIEHISRGTYELGTNGGARFTKLDAGDIVHTAKETRKILGRGGAEHGSKMAGGTSAVGSNGNAAPYANWAYLNLQESVIEKAANAARRKAEAGAEHAREMNEDSDATGKVLLEWIKKHLDWIPTYLSVLKKKTTAFINAADDAIHYISKNKLIDEAISNVSEEIKANRESLARYRAFLAEAANEGQLSDEIISKIQNGTIDIELYSDEDMVKAIQSFQEYWNKLVACSDALKTLNDQMQALSAQKLDYVVSYFERIDGLLKDQQKTFESLLDMKKQYGQELTVSDYMDSLKTMEQVLANAQNEEAALIQELQDQLGVDGDLVKTILDGGREVWDTISEHVQKNFDNSIFKITTSEENTDTETQTSGNSTGNTNKVRLRNNAMLTRNDDGTFTYVGSGGTEFLATQELLDAFVRAGYLPESFIKGGKVKQDDKLVNVKIPKETATKTVELPKAIETGADGRTVHAGNGVYRFYDDMQSAYIAPVSEEQKYVDPEDINLDELEKQNVSIPVEPMTDDEIIALGEKLGLVMADGSDEALANFETIKSLLEATWEHPLAIGSDTWYEYMSTLEQLRESIYSTQTEIGELKDEMSEIPLTNLKTGFDYLDTIRQNLEDTNNLLDAQGSSKYPDTFRSLISVGMKQIENLQEQNKLIQAQMDSLDPLSEKYQELRSNLNSNLDTIADIRKNQEEWNDEIIDLQIDRLKKQNDTYKEQLRLMQALDDLDKARQRRLLVYHDEGGFRYEADEDALEDAQEAANDAILNSLVSGLERSKENSNIYGPLGERLVSDSGIVDSLGNVLVPVIDKLSSLNFEPYYQSIVSGAEQSGLLTSMLNSIDMAKLLEASIGGNVSIDIGNMTLNEVQNAKDLGDAIIEQLPGYLFQALYQKGAN